MSTTSSFEKNKQKKKRPSIIIKSTQQQQLIPTNFQNWHLFWNALHNSSLSQYTLYHTYFVISRCKLQSLREKTKYTYHFTDFTYYIHTILLNSTKKSYTHYTYFRLRTCSFFFFFFLHYVLFYKISPLLYKKHQYIVRYFLRHHHYHPWEIIIQFFFSWPVVLYRFRIK